MSTAMSSSHHGWTPDISVKLFFHLLLLPRVVVWAMDRLSAQRRPFKAPSPLSVRQKVPFAQGGFSRRKTFPPRGRKKHTTCSSPGTTEDSSPPDRPSSPPPPPATQRKRRGQITSAMSKGNCCLRPVQVRLLHSQNTLLSAPLSLVLLRLVLCQHPLLLLLRLHLFVDPPVQLLLLTARSSLPRVGERA